MPQPSTTAVTRSTRWSLSVSAILRQLAKAGDSVRRLYTASAMAEVTYHAVVWIGVVGVVPQEGCELLAPQEGAFINFLTLANSESEYRAKVSGALSAYRLDPMEFEDVRPFSEPDNPSQEILSIAAELKESRNPKHVRYATFHTYPRVM
jgi:hypothetical protein